MKVSSAIVIAAIMAVFGGHLGCSCIGGKSIPRPYAEPSVEQVLAHLRDVRQNIVSFQAESVMDYWVGNERVKATVLLMGRTGAFIRINALNPTGDNVAADLACDGQGFKYIDYNNDCQLVGPCDSSSIARLLRISLEPDDFMLLVVGTTPVIGQARGSLEWDAEHGREVVRLTTPDGSLSQTIVLDGKDRRWDVLSSVVTDASGKKLWTLRNKDFHPVKTAGGSVFRVPGKTQFKQPQEKADLLVRWKEHILNPDLDDRKFTMDIPPGLPTCGTRSAAQ